MKKCVKYKEFIDIYLQNGRNATKAYLKLYPKCAYQTAQPNSSRLMKHPLTKAYLAERELELKEKYNITREKMADKLLTVVDQCENDGDRRSLLKAIEILNKIYGLDAPIKQEINHTGLNINYIVPGNDKEKPGKNIY